MASQVVSYTAVSGQCWTLIVYFLHCHMNLNILPCKLGCFWFPVWSLGSSTRRYCLDPPTKLVVLGHSILLQFNFSRVLIFVMYFVSLNFCKKIIITITTSTMLTNFLIHMQFLNSIFHLSWVIFTYSKITKYICKWKWVELDLFICLRFY